MAYGRLDVFWPDGKFETFPLGAPSVSVGRSSGNTITLDTDTISRYHFSITQEEGDVYITDLDSANGTFVDGVRLESNQKRLLDGVEEIQIGHLRIIYRPVDDSPTLPLSALSDDTQRLVSEAMNFNIEVEGPEIAISPGAYTTAELCITNTGDEERSFQVEVSGIPEKWVRINRPHLMIEPNDPALVTINFKPLRRSESTPGDYPVTIRVSPTDKPEAGLNADIIVTILPYGGFGIALSTPKVEIGEPFRLHLHNQGSADLPLSITAKDKRNRLDFELPSSDIVLTPGQRLQIQGTIKPKKPMLIGSPVEHAFDLVVQAKTPARFLAAVQGRCLESPRIPTWAAITAVGILASIVLLVAFVLVTALKTPPPEPHIALFEVNSTQVAQGESLALKWEATDVDSFTVSLNNTPVVTDLGPQSSGVNLETDALHGEVAISLLGANGDVQDEAVRLVQVYQPLSVEHFTVKPSKLVRNVVQTITIDWNAPGALYTRISGLDNFTTSGIAGEYGAQDSIVDLAGIPADTFSITLFAEGEIGNTVEQTLIVDVVNPECVPVRDDVPLRAGPNVLHPVVQTVSRDVSVVVDAQDETGQWLRARLAGGIEGWGILSDFTCADNVNVSGLRIELNVPVPPTITPTPTVTPLPTLTPTTIPSSTSTPPPTPTETPGSS